ncbi:MAG: phosphagen kinase [Campylobacterota bacterium]|nr:phosphagen kinase [Campylobacterota bacterium]
MKETSSFPKFPLTCKSLLCKYLTVPIFEELKDKKTRNDFSFLDVINSGLVNPDSGVGVYAGDEESYRLFSPLFDSIIEDYHGFGVNDSHQSNLNPNDLNAPNPDEAGEYIISTRIRVGRNVANMPLGPAISKQERNQIEADVSSALGNLSGSLAGKYYPIKGMSEDDRVRLIGEHFLFKAGDRFLEATGLNRDWPDGRGIFHNDEKTFLVWINEEDQLRIISMQQGGDIKEVFKRLVDAISHIEKVVPFSYNEHLGYITSCPTNLGTAMRASVHIKVPKLASDMESFKAITDKYHLQIRGIHGEHSESEGGIYDISNRRRLGVSEVQCVQDMFDGVSALIAKEKSL